MGERIWLVRLDFGGDATLDKTSPEPASPSQAGKRILGQTLGEQGHDNPCLRMRAWLAAHWRNHHVAYSRNGRRLAS